MAKTLVYYRRVHTLPDLLIFLHNLSLDVRPKVNTLSPCLLFVRADTDVNSDWACGVKFPPIRFPIPPKFIAVKKERHFGEYSAKSLGIMCDQELNSAWSNIVILYSPAYTTTRSSLLHKWRPRYCMATARLQLSTLGRKPSWLPN